jgi:hypothetical protein
LIRITRVFGAAAMAVAERDEPSITAISPKIHSFSFIILLQSHRVAQIDSDPLS